ncbi:MAG: DUF1588 domain-containing protein [Myxococcaceae bacterium]
MPTETCEPAGVWNLLPPHAPLFYSQGVGGFSLLSVPAGSTPPLRPTPTKAPGLSGKINEAHATDPTCAGCHAHFDGIGFGLERFDAIGAERSTDNGLPIADSGTLVRSYVGSDAFRFVRP